MPSVFSPQLFHAQVILITGGSRGGMLKETARQFLLHGAHAVILMSRSADKNEAVCASLRQYGQCISMPGDVSKPEQCQKVAQEIVKQFGRIDVLVNGAAGNFLATAERLSVGGLRRVLEIDTIGTFNMSQAVFKASMKQRRQGVVINVSACLHWNGTFGQAHSAAAKAGVDALTKVMATEWGPFNVRVVGIVPGYIQGTEGFERLGDLNNLNNKQATEQAYSTQSTSKSSPLEQMKSIIPLQRFGQVEDTANAALFMASPAASYITGTTLLFDGGVDLTSPNCMFSMPPFVAQWSKGRL